MPPTPNIRACVGPRYLIPLLALLLWARPAYAATQSPQSRYLALLENFVAYAERNWDEAQDCFAAKGKGVSLQRGNGSVCMAYAVLLSERPAQETFSTPPVRRAVMIDHVRRTVRTMCLTNKHCTAPEAVKPSLWGGPSWQAALETSFWAWAVWLLGKELDEDTRQLAREVITAEADALKKELPSNIKGDTGSEDCVWNAPLLAVAANMYPDDPRAASWDEWCKRWALNSFSREPDRNSVIKVDGKPLGEWLSSTNVHPDLTIENHEFWSIPYQVDLSGLSECDMAYHRRGRSTPEAVQFFTPELWKEVLSWLVLPDGDFLCPQGQDWAPRDVQHIATFAWLGSRFHIAAAQQCEQDCLDLLMRRHAAFGDGALHALDFGYETSVVQHWASATLLHNELDGERSPTLTVQPQHGAKNFLNVCTAVERTDQLVSSVSWAPSRQTIMVVPVDRESLGEHPSFIKYDPRCGAGWVAIGNETLPTALVSEPKFGDQPGILAVTFTREFPAIARQRINFVALDAGPVVVFSLWEAIAEQKFSQVVSHPYFCLAIDGFLPPRNLEQDAKDSWSLDGKLQMKIIGGAGGKRDRDTLLGSVRKSVKGNTGDVLDHSVCVYQAITKTNDPMPVSGTVQAVTVGPFTIETTPDGPPIVKQAKQQQKSPLK